MNKPLVLVLHPDKSPAVKSLDADISKLYIAMPADHPMQKQWDEYAEHSGAKKLGTADAQRMRLFREWAQKSLQEYWFYEKNIQSSMGKLAHVAANGVKLKLQTPEQISAGVDEDFWEALEEERNGGRAIGNKNQKNAHFACSHMSLKVKEKSSQTDGILEKWLMHLHKEGVVSYITSPSLTRSVSGTPLGQDAVLADFVPYGGVSIYKDWGQVERSLNRYSASQVPEGAKQLVGSVDAVAKSTKKYDWAAGNEVRLPEKFRRIFNTTPTLFLLLPSGGGFKVSTDVDLGHFGLNPKETDVNAHGMYVMIPGAFLNREEPQLEQKEKDREKRNEELLQKLKSLIMPVLQSHKEEVVGIRKVLASKEAVKISLIPRGADSSRMDIDFRESMAIKHSKGPKSSAVGSQEILQSLVHSEKFTLRGDTKGFKNASKAWGEVAQKLVSMGFGVYLEVNSVQEVIAHNGGSSGSKEAHTFKSVGTSWVGQSDALTRQNAPGAPLQGHIFIGEDVYQSWGQLCREQALAVGCQLGFSDELLKKIAFNPKVLFEPNTYVSDVEYAHYEQKVRDSRTNAPVSTVEQPLVDQTKQGVEEGIQVAEPKVRADTFMLPDEVLNVKPVRQPEIPLVKVHLHRQEKESQGHQDPQGASVAGQKVSLVRHKL